MNDTAWRGRNFDRTAEDLGNIVQFGHVNVTVPEHRLATVFYVSGLGFTRDPFMMTGCENMWVNVGHEQLHLPVDRPQVIRGTIGVVVPDMSQLRTRLARVQDYLAGTRFAVSDTDDALEVRGPWGNRLRCHAPDTRRFGRMRLGIPYLELDMPPDVNLGAIARFYRRIVGAKSGLDRDRQGRSAWISLGAHTRLIFRETAETPAQYDGHHIQITVANFSGPYRKLRDRGLITEESDQHQYRFRDIVDPETNEPLFTLEHEVRSMLHPMFGRALVNRNPSQTNDGYVPECDSFGCTLPIS